MLEGNLPHERQDSELGRDIDDDAGEDAYRPSLTDDIGDLLDDGKTYFEAEVAFQKTRLSFVLKKGQKVAFMGLMALGFLHLALIALVVGAVIALSPILTPIGATLAVTVVLLIVAIVFLLSAKRRAEEASSAFDEGGQ